MTDYGKRTLTWKDKEDALDSVETHETPREVLGGERPRRALQAAAGN